MVYMVLPGYRLTDFRLKDKGLRKLHSPNSISFVLFHHTYSLLESCDVSPPVLGYCFWESIYGLKHVANRVAKLQAMPHRSVRLDCVEVTPAFFLEDNVSAYPQVGDYLLNSAYAETGRLSNLLGCGTWMHGYITEHACVVGKKCPLSLFHLLRHSSIIFALANGPTQAIEVQMHLSLYAYRNSCIAICIMIPCEPTWESSKCTD